MCFQNYNISKKKCKCDHLDYHIAKVIQRIPKKLRGQFPYQAPSCGSYENRLEKISEHMIIWTIWLCHLTWCIDQLITKSSQKLYPRCKIYCTVMLQHIYWEQQPPFWGFSYTCFCFCLFTIEDPFSRKLGTSNICKSMLFGRTKWI